MDNIKIIVDDTNSNQTGIFITYKIIVNNVTSNQKFQANLTYEQIKDLDCKGILDLGWENIKMRFTEWLNTMSIRNELNNYKETEYKPVTN